MHDTTIYLADGSRTMGANSSVIATMSSPKVVLMTRRYMVFSTETRCGTRDKAYLGSRISDLPHIALFI
jgi:hypothetical protein